jgi:hypothetical protein
VKHNHPIYRLLRISSSTIKKRRNLEGVDNMNRLAPYRLPPLAVLIGLGLLFLSHIVDIPINTLTFSNVFDLLTIDLQKQDSIELFKHISTSTTKL